MSSTVVLILWNLLFEKSRNVSFFGQKRQWPKLFEHICQHNNIHSIIMSTHNIDMKITKFLERPETQTRNPSNLITSWHRVNTYFWKLRCHFIPAFNGLNELSTARIKFLERTSKIIFDKYATTIFLQNYFMKRAIVRWNNMRNPYLKINTPTRLLRRNWNITSFLKSKRKWTSRAKKEMLESLLPFLILSQVCLHKLKLLFCDCCF